MAERGRLCHHRRVPRFEADRLFDMPKGVALFTRNAADNLAVKVVRTRVVVVVVDVDPLTVM